MSAGDPDRTGIRRPDASGFLDWLLRSGWSAIPGGPIPPIDPTVVRQARMDAFEAARAAGRDDDLRQLQARIADWLVDQYTRMGFRGAYFMGSLDTPQRRLEQLQVLTDAATAYALSDVLPEETWTNLVARFDVYHGGELFGPAADDGPADAGQR